VQISRWFKMFKTKTFTTYTVNRIRQTTSREITFTITIIILNPSTICLKTMNTSH
jgi:hypothetical protein